MPAHEPSNGGSHPWPADGQAPAAEGRAGVGAVAVGRSAGVEPALGPDERVDFGAHQLVDDLQTDRARGGQKALARMGGERREMALDPLREGDGQGWRGAVHWALPLAGGLRLHGIRANLVSTKAKRFSDPYRRVPGVSQHHRPPKTKARRNQWPRPPPRAMVRNDTTDDRKRHEPPDGCREKRQKSEERVGDGWIEWMACGQFVGTSELIRVENSVGPLQVLSRVATCGRE